MYEQCEIDKFLHRDTFKAEMYENILQETSLFGEQSYLLRRNDASMLWEDL